MARPRPIVDPYEGEDGQWYWRLIARNNKIVADGAEGYVSESNARRAGRRFIEMAAEAVLSDE